MIRRLRERKDDEGGYVAILVSLLMVLLFSMAAFSVDVGNWYLTGQQLQKEADAAALAGVPALPNEPATAYSVAATTVRANHDADATTRIVESQLDDSPTRLRVTVSTTVQNVFGQLLGIGSTTISRTAVADYAAPVPMGSPCNLFGSDPDAIAVGTACKDEKGALVSGQFWANVGTPGASKGSGDRFHNNTGCSASVSGCSGSKNLDYSPDGYFYSITLTRPVANLVIEAFDPALVHVGDTCGSNLDTAATAINDQTTDWARRYAKGPSSPFCTGDIRFGGTGEAITKFTVRDPSDNPWDPLSFPPHPGCDVSFAGYNGNVFNAVDQYENDATKKPRTTYRPEVAKVFRTWQPLCKISYAPAGTYLVQVKTAGTGNDAASGHNRFALRAYSSSDPSAKDVVSVSGYQRMAIYANLPSAQTSFYLARVPAGAAGQRLNVTLFDIGDSDKTGTVTLLAPPDSGVTFKDCTLTGVVSGVRGDCSMTASGSFNGKLQTISVTIPDGYDCDIGDPTKCWVRLRYDYGAGSQPSDTTSWTASIDGDPVRLIE
jgi:hypothetical protein